MLSQLREQNSRLNVDLSNLSDNDVLGKVKDKVLRQRAIQVIFERDSEKCLKFQENWLRKNFDNLNELRNIPAGLLKNLLSSKKATVALKTLVCGAIVMNPELLAEKEEWPIESSAAYQVVILNMLIEKAYPDSVLILYKYFNKVQNKEKANQLINMTLNDLDNRATQVSRLTALGNIVTVENSKKNSSGQVENDVLTRLKKYFGSSIKLNQAEILNGLIVKIQQDNSRQNKAACKTIATLKLNEVQTSHILPALVEKFSGAEWAQKAACEAINSLTLTKFQEDYISTILEKKLKDSDRRKRKHVYSVIPLLNLSREQTTFIFPILIDTLTNSVDSERGGIYHAIGSLNLNITQTEQILTILHAKLKLDAKGYTSWEAGIACSTIGLLKLNADQTKRIFPDLIVKLNDNDEMVRATACKAINSLMLNEQQIKEISSVLLTMLSDYSVSVRREACKAIGGLALNESQKQDVLTLLVAKLNDNYSEVRRIACGVIGSLILNNLQIDGVLPVLVLKLSDYNMEVRRSAYNAITKLNLNAIQINGVIAVLNATLMLNHDLLAQNAFHIIIGNLGMQGLIGCDKLKAINQGKPETLKYVAAFAECKKSEEHSELRSKPLTYHYSSVVVQNISGENVPNRIKGYSEASESQRKKC